jgi:alpha-D-ribose 1-methylphosphonate 5-triphosphate diphosphatase PhnM
MDFTNIEEDEQEETNENIEVQNLHDNKNYRYLNIIKLLGLNEKINYPHNIIISGIIEMHTDTHGPHMYIRKTMVFKNNSVSKQISENLFGGSPTNSVSYMSISRQIKRLYRQYKYENMNIHNMIDEILGFNYENPRWIPLESYDIE